LLAIDMSGVERVTWAETDRLSATKRAIAAFGER
jgi:hypothetical protein